MLKSFLTRVATEEEKPEFKCDEVAVVAQKWFEAENRPRQGEAEDAEKKFSEWQLGDHKVVCHNLCHEYAMTLLKATIHPSATIKCLLAKCQVLAYYLLPHSKLMTTTVFWLTEEGVRQLLSYHLAVLFFHLAVKSEKRGSTGSAMQGMLSWAYRQFVALETVKAPFCDLATHRRSVLALLLMYVEGKDETHTIGLRLAAMNEFLELKDLARYKATEMKVPPHTTVDPTTKFDLPEPQGPSTLDTLLSLEPLSKLCLDLQV